MIDSYTSLQATVARWTNRDDTAFLDEIPTFITLGEARIRRNQEWFERVYSDVYAGPLAVTANPQPTNAGAKEVLAVWASTNAYKHPIDIISYTQLHQLAATNRDANGIPTKVAITTPFMTFRFWPTPALDGSFAVDFKYIWDVAPLATEATNSLLSRHPDLYLYAALAETAPYLLHDERVPLWEQRYQLCVREINMEREHAVYGAGRKRVTLPKVF